jgi:hypothetical protein
MIFLTTPSLGIPDSIKVSISITTGNSFFFASVEDKNKSLMAAKLASMRLFN